MGGILIAGVINIKKEKILGPFFCLLAAVVWGLSFVAQSEGAQIGTFTFNALRMLLGGIVLVPFAIISVLNDKKRFPLKKFLSEAFAVQFLSLSDVIFSNMHSFSVLKQAK